MNLASDFASVISATVHEGRELAESLMTDACSISRVDLSAEPGEMDPETGQYPEAARVTIYAGKCRLQIKSVTASSTNSTAGDRVATVQEYEWQGPVIGTEHISVDDVIEMTTCAMDVAVEGRKLTVASLHAKSQATARRLRVREATA